MSFERQEVAAAYQFEKLQNLDGRDKEANDLWNNR